MSHWNTARKAFRHLQTSRSAYVPQKPVSVANVPIQVLSSFQFTRRRNPVRAKNALKQTKFPLRHAPLKPVFVVNAKAQVLFTFRLTRIWSLFSWQMFQCKSYHPFSSRAAETPSAQKML